MGEPANQRNGLIASNRLWRHPPFHNNLADMADAHSFTWHGTGQSLLEAKLRAIDPARSSVCMESFTFRDSDVGLRFRIPISCDALQQGRPWRERLKQRLAYWLFARLDPELAALKSQAWHLRKDPFVRRVKRARRANLRNT